MIAVTLSENQWQTAHAIARQLIIDETDPNELGKAISYLRAYNTQPDAGERFFQYLATLANNGRKIGHSKKTSDYYRNIEGICRQYLNAYTSNTEGMLQILGWAFRLTRYYKGMPIAEVKALANEETLQPIESERQAEIAQVLESHDFSEGQILEAIVVAIKGNKVTYELLGTIKLTEKEPKKASQLSEGQTVSVEIISIKEDGSIKKVKCVS